MRGLHFIAELYECRCAPALLADADALRALCLEVCAVPGLTPVGQVFHQFGSADAPAGATGAVIPPNRISPHVAGTARSDARPLRLQLQPGQQRRRTRGLRAPAGGLQPQRVVRREIARGEPVNAADILRADKTSSGRPWKPRAFCSIRAKFRPTGTTSSPISPIRRRRRWARRPAGAAGEDGRDLPDEHPRAGDVGSALDSDSRGGAADLRLWRPAPLCRALRLEQALGTPAKIFYKNEGVSPAGSHKPNSAVPQAYYNHAAGIRRMTTETGAGQWGSSLAFAGQMFGIAVRIYMVKVSYQQKPFRRSLMQTWGAKSSPARPT